MRVRLVTSTNVQNEESLQGIGPILLGSGNLPTETEGNLKSKGSDRVVGRWESAH